MIVKVFNYISVEIKTLFNKMRLFAPHESYLVRHKILEFLFDKANEESEPQEPSVPYMIAEISDAINISPEKVNRYHEFLNETGEIKCERGCNDLEMDHQMTITSEGRHAYINLKYLKEGKKEKRELIKDFASMIAPVISLLSLIVATIAVSKSCSQSPQENILKLQIKSEVPQLKIQQLKDTLNQPKTQGR